MKLFELDPNNPIDRELEKTAQGAAKDGSMDPDDIEGQEDPEMEPGQAQQEPQNEPDPAMANSMPDEPSESPAKPVDSALLSRVQGHDYIQNYSHDDENKSHHPISILNLQMDELSDLRKRIRVYLDRTGLEDRVGSYSNPEVKTAQDMLAFVDLVMMHKKKAAKDVQKTGGSGGSKKPRVQQQKPPKTKPGKQVKAKQN